MAIDPTLAMYLVVAVLGLVLFMLLAKRRRQAQEARRAERRRGGRRRDDALQEVPSSDTVREARPAPGRPMLRTYAMPVVDQGEMRILNQLEALVRNANAGHRILAQIALSGFVYNGSKGLSKQDEDEIAQLLSSRIVDFLVVDRDWNPVTAIGLERDALSAGAEDGVEAHACESAGVCYMRVSPLGFTETETGALEDLLRPAATIAAQ